MNIHPSLLPLYCGAAPVQRALQNGVKETGVSLAFIVRALDAGPVIACERLEVNDQIKAPDLLEFLFSKGSELLICELPSILDGSAKVKAKPQDDSKATLAPKITPEESWLYFDKEALVLHYKGNEVDDITFVKDALAFPCAGCTTLEVLGVQLPGKKVISAAAFWNGLQGQK
ncbi:hypothetical protein SO802_002586, partial [Lithocarpus litseifolius]